MNIVIDFKEYYKEIEARKKVIDTVGFKII